METTKEKKMLHGIGMYSVQQVVEKYGGILKYKDKVLSGKLNDVPSGRLFRADLGSLQIG